MSLVVDGVFFQLARSGIARIWQAVLPMLAQRVDMPVIFLDRASMGLSIPGVEIVPFPTYKARFNAQDSQLLERVCRHYGAKAFMSTYYTTPIETPSLLLVYDMIPERMGFDLDARDWREKELAIAHARRHVSISCQTRKDLLEYYPELRPEDATVAYCGVDPSVFKPSTPEAIAGFRREFDLPRPYFVFVGSRVQTKDYKNARLFFEALSAMQNIDFDVLCVGGEKELPECDQAQKGFKMLRVDLDDAQLAVAYAGAAALVYPSLYEGFGLPVAEAMSCRCPVISTRRGSLPEVTGEAALCIAGDSVSELIAALGSVRQPAVRDRLIALGEHQSSKFRWETFADEVAANIGYLVEQSDSDACRAFYAQWARLRSLQGEVDVLV